MKELLINIWLINGIIFGSLVLIMFVTALIYMLFGIFKEEEEKKKC